MTKKEYPSREFSNAELTVSTWLVRHLPLMRRILYGSFIALDAVLIIVAVSGVLKFSLGTAAHRATLSALSQELIDWQALRPLVQSKPLVIQFVQAVSAGTNTDFVARVENQNQNRWGTFRYRFTWEEGETEWREAFIMPSETKHLLALGSETIAPRGVTLELGNERWIRASEGTGAELARARGYLSVTESSFVPYLTGASGELPVSAVRFAIENAGPFRYENVGVAVVVYSGTAVSAANFITLSELLPRGTREAEVRWFYPIPVLELRSIVVEPSVNFFDEDVIFT